MNLEKQQKTKAVFLDRDGTILKEITGDDPLKPASKGYLTRTEEVELIEGSAEAIAKIRELGFKVIIVTNQSAIARGWISELLLQTSLLLRADGYRKKTWIILIVKCISFSKKKTAKH
jgi:histidinol phosphatase-like enzyme